MDCANCQHGNANDARFCAQCGAPLTQPLTAATVPTSVATPAPGGRHNSRLTTLAVLVLLLFAIGLGAALRVIANRGGTPPAGDRQPAVRSADSSARAAAPAQPAPAVGNATRSGLRNEPREKASNPGAPDTADGAQAATAVAGFLGDLTSAVGGAHRHDPVDFHTLEALLPSSLPGMPPATPEGNADETMSIKTTSADVDFSGANDARIHLSIKDATAISGLAGFAEMANSQTTQQGDSYEKAETIGGRSVHEQWDAPARHGELSLSVGQRFAVDVVGDHVDMDALKDALARIDLARLESLKDANPVAK
jgi:hypothetical protein